MSILAVTGLNREARIIAGPGIATLASGGVAMTLAGRMETALASDVYAVISIGIAGALEPSLKVGDAVVDGDPDWRDRIIATLSNARSGRIVGSAEMIVDAPAKAALHASTSAWAVDMESHVAADVAAKHGRPFVALRIISDRADRALPKAAQVGMRPDGGMDIPAVLGALIADPSQLPALIRTGLEADVAFKALANARQALGPHLGFNPARLSP